MEAYTDLITGLTQMLEPHDEMELIWTKEATDATWEARRLSRQKKLLAERRYRKRLEAQAECARVLAQHRARSGQENNKGPDLAAIMAKTPTADDLDHGLEAGFPHYQALDIAQSRASKRRDSAFRQIARWRDGLGGKARALSDRFVAEEALAERYGVDHFLADAEVEAIEAAPPHVPSDKTAQTLPAPASAGEVPVPPMDATAGVTGETAKAASPLAPAGGIAEAVQAAPPLAGAGEPALAPTDGAAKAVPPPAPTGETAKAVRQVDPAVGAAQAAPLLACAGEPALAPADDGAKAVPLLAPAGEVAQAAPSVGSSGEIPKAARSVALPDETERINWVDWLTGAKKYEWVVLVVGAQKKFKQVFPSKEALVQKLVVDCKFIPPDRVCPELARYLPAIAEAAPTLTPSGGSRNELREANRRQSKKWPKEPGTADGSWESCFESQRPTAPIGQHQPPQCCFCATD
jgi:hypothetical protein